MRTIRWMWGAEERWHVGHSEGAVLDIAAERKLR